MEVRPTPYHTLSWLGPPCATRTHKNTFSRLGLDEENAKQVIKQACPLTAFWGTDFNLIWMCYCVSIDTWLEWGAAGSQRPSCRHSGGEAAEGQNSAPGRQAQPQVSSNKSQWHFAFPPTHLNPRPFFQVNSGFVKAVAQGAETVVDGFVEPVNGNPEDPAFLWGGLFMSQGAEVGMFGGERGRRWAKTQLNNLADTVL